MEENFNKNLAKAQRTFLWLTRKDRVSPMQR